MAGLLNPAVARTGLLAIRALQAAPPAASPQRSSVLTPAAAPAPAQTQDRPYGLLSFADDFFFGGRASQLRANRRDRHRAEALRPEREARIAQLRQIATGMGPAALVAFETNPEKFGESLAQQYEPTTTSAGGRTDILGTGQGVTAPTFMLNGDTVVRNEPGNGASTPTFTRGPTYAEETGRINSTNPVSVAANANLVDPITRETVSEGYRPPEIVSTPAGGSSTVFRDGVPTTSVQGNAKPMTNVERTQAREDMDVINTAEGINTNLDALIGQIDAGTLNLGPMTNLLSQGRNAMGASDQNSRNFASFRASLEKLRNDSLRLNTGVQTDGDSRRAWDELVANINDEKVVSQRLREIREINRRAIRYRQDRLADTGSQPNAPSAVAAPRSRAEYEALPPGTRFRAPDGTVRVKP